MSPVALVYLARGTELLQTAATSQLTPHHPLTTLSLAAWRISISLQAICAAPGGGGGTLFLSPFFIPRDSLQLLLLLNLLLQHPLPFLILLLLPQPHPHLLSFLHPFHDQVHLLPQRFRKIIQFFPSLSTKVVISLAKSESNLEMEMAMPTINEWVNSVSVQTRLLSTEYSRTFTPMPMVFRLLPNFNIFLLVMIKHQDCCFEICSFRVNSFTGFTIRDLFLMCFESGMFFMSNDTETNAGFVLRRSRRLQGSHVRTEQRCSQLCNWSQSEHQKKLQLSSYATFNLLISTVSYICISYLRHI